MSSCSSAPVKEQPWYAALPLPKATPVQLQAEELKTLMDPLSTTQSNVTHLVVDVRRTDFEDAFIRGAVNLPAQSFYQTLPSLIPLLTRYNTVAFHCSSSAGRGPRCAAWYQDALDERGIGAEVSQGAVLVGGIKRWVELYGKEGMLTSRL